MLTKEERLKKDTETQIQLVTLYILMNEYSEYQFKKIVKTNDALKISIGKLEWFKEIHFFSWFLIKKMQDKQLRMFKLVKIGRNYIAPVQIADKGTKVEVRGQ